MYEQYSGHRGPITALDFHPAHGPVDFSDYFLTSSVDWSVKLWNKKVPPAFYLTLFYIFKNH